VIDARNAADLVGATYMDRPEWVAIHPVTKELFCTLTNNSARGRAAPFGQKEILGTDAANPRSPNIMGHVIRWREANNDPTATRFTWNIFVQAGDPDHSDPIKRGTAKLAFAQPDGLYVDRGCCGFRPTALRGTWQRKTGPASATTRCWPPIRARAKSGGSW
jgi:secreted PhoX family phosphatase